MLQGAVHQLYIRYGRSSEGKFSFGARTNSSDDEAAGDEQSSVGTSLRGGSPPRKRLQLSLFRGKNTHKADSVNEENR